MKTKYADLIANRILFLCDKRRITISDLSEMSGVRQSTISSIVNNGSDNPKIQTLHKIALGFGMTLAEFLNFKELNDFSFDD